MKKSGKKTFFVKNLPNSKDFSKDFTFLNQIGFNISKSLQNLFQLQHWLLKKSVPYSRYFCPFFTSFLGIFTVASRTVETTGLGRSTLPLLGKCTMFPIVFVMLGVCHHYSRIVMRLPHMFIFNCKMLFDSPTQHRCIHVLRFLFT